VQAVPAPPVRQDRTYAAAASLAKWLRQHGGLPARMHLLTRAPTRAAPGYYTGKHWERM